MNNHKKTRRRAGDDLGEFAPKFAQLNDDVLFGEVWSREEQLSARGRSLMTALPSISAGKAKGTPTMEQAYQMGRNV